MKFTEYLNNEYGLTVEAFYDLTEYEQEFIEDEYKKIVVENQRQVKGTQETNLFSCRCLARTAKAFINRVLTCRRNN